MGKLETITVNRSGSAKSPTIKSKYPYPGEGYTRGTREKGANQTYAFQSLRVVGAVGVEPTTNGLKGRCSATELRPCGSHHSIRKRLTGDGRLHPVQAQLQFRNDALHADWNKIDVVGVRTVLQLVQELLLKHF